MPPEPIHVAIETSTRDGSLAVARAGALLEAVSIGQQQRHAVQLLPALQALADRHGFAPADIAAVSLSIGPGSFTGLRIAVTVAKLLARTVGCKLVAVPTLEVIAQNVPVDRPCLAVCLNAKSGRCFVGLFDRADDGWRPRGQAALMRPEELAAAAPRPLGLIGDDAVVQMDWPRDIDRLDPVLAVPRAEHVWRLGRALAAAQRFADPYRLTPLYVRLPDAEEKWRQREER